ncbi:hypothetical protein M3Y99_00190700 [Aphelenchoides fujianensis]|nr:hypothetical protein M3Y99_00190700 [Aphelenchoides fujianensis]
MIRGTSLPLFSIIYGQIFKTLSLGSNEEKLHKAVMNLVYFCILGAAAFVTTGLFIRAGESITRRLRLALFREHSETRREPILSFSIPTLRPHAAGKLSARLSTDAPNVRAAIDQRLADVIHAASAIVVGIVIAFQLRAGKWPQSGFLQPASCVRAVEKTCLQTAVARYLKSRGNEDAKLAEEPSRASDQNQHVYRSFACSWPPNRWGEKETFDERFTQLNARPPSTGDHSGIIQALTYAFQSAYVFFNFAAAYRFGVFLVSRREVDPYTVFQ